MRRNEKGFTLMELMVVIVIVAILAAVAVPLYMNYVKDAQRADAKAVIGAIITAQQSYFLKSPSFTPTETPIYASRLQDLVDRGFLNPGFQADVQKRWGTPTMTGTATAFSVTLTNPNDASVSEMYEYDQTAGGTWTP